jgi:hypothetical protein
VEHRELRPNESGLIRRILNSASASALLAQIDEASVYECDREGSLRFSHPPVDSEQRKFPTEAEALDVDGMPIHALLFVAGQWLDEVEFYKDDSSAIVQFPEPDKWEIVTLG